MRGHLKSEYLRQLAQKLLAGKATAEEKLFLEEYYNTFDNGIDAKQDLSENELRALEDSIRHRIYTRLVDDGIPVTRRIHPYWRWTAAAAALLVISAFAVFFLNKGENMPAIVHVPASPADVAPGGNKATLTLHDGTTISLDEARAGTLAREGEVAVNKVTDGKITYDATNQAGPSSVTNFNTIATPRGGQYHVVLPDGTNVWLNATSSIYFPTSFNTNERNVSITGEVYFEVARNARQPFVVSVGSATVRVLGTHFNVMAYKNEATVKTTLVEGSVSISEAGRAVTLQPGEQLLCSDEQFHVVQHADVEAALAWKNGLFHFKDAGIESIMKQAERWYDISVKYEGQIPDKQFNGTVSRNVNLSELIEIFSFYDDIECTIEGKTVIIKRKRNQNI